MCGLLIQKKIISTKKGERMAFIQLEDLHNHAEIIIFPKLFKVIEPWLQDYSIFVVKGTLDLAAADSCKIKANQCVPLDLIFHSWNKIAQCQLSLPADIDVQQLAVLKDLEKGSVSLQVTYQEENRMLQLISKKQIGLSYDLLSKFSTAGITGKIIL